MRPQVARAQAAAPLPLMRAGRRPLPLPLMLPPPPPPPLTLLLLLLVLLRDNDSKQGRTWGAAPAPDANSDGALPQNSKKRGTEVATITERSAVSETRRCSCGHEAKLAAQQKVILSMQDNWGMQQQMAHQRSARMQHARLISACSDAYPRTYGWDYIDDLLFSFFIGPLCPNKWSEMERAAHLLMFLGDFKSVEEL